MHVLDVRPWRLLLFSRWVVASSLRPHGPQHARLPWPTLSPRVCLNSCPLSQWCYLINSSSAAPLLLLPSVFPSIRVFSDELALCIRWPKYWCFSFSISPSNEYSGLISFRMDWFYLLVVQGLSRVFSSTTVQKHQFLLVTLGTVPILVLANWPSRSSWASGWSQTTQPHISVPFLNWSWTWRNGGKEEITRVGCLL